MGIVSTLNTAASTESTKYISQLHPQNMDKREKNNAKRFALHLNAITFIPEDV